jgi:hypothetical protein
MSFDDDGPGPDRDLDGVADAVLRIDCAECALEGTDACRDCVVTFLCDRAPGDAVTIDLAEERSIRLLAEVGLVPALRHVRRTS